MFRLPVIGLMILLICFQFGFKSVIFINWKVNRTRITEKYCVNKDKPAMNCNGQCYLARQLRAAELESKRMEAGEHSRNDLPLQKASSIKNALYLPAMYVPAIHMYGHRSKSYETAAIPALRNAFRPRVFHPPSC